MPSQISSSKFRSPLRYPGGKQKAITEIAKLLPVSVLEYREPLVGGASVYFHAKTVNLAKHYWINDAFKELVSFWQIVQDPHTCQQLIADLAKMRSSFSQAQQTRAYYEATKRECSSDTYRQALLFFFYNRVTFSGTTRAGGFSNLASTKRFTASSIERLSPMPEALAKTKITNLDFEEIILASGQDVFLFLDPPYFTAKKLYGNKGQLHQFDHEKLASLLKKTKHRFLITYDNCPEIRQLYKWAQLHNWQLQYGMNNCNAKNQSKIGAELFIYNY